nr:TRAF3-interacting protein 1 isoform X4 [Manis javanica]
MTGFMKGLYTDAEMKSDNVKDKEAKISFLQKAIDVVVMVSGEPLSAKPARIVAGHEPERTNELLQRIGKCCLSKLPSDEAVKRVLAGEKGHEKGRTSLTSKSQALNNRDVRGNEPGHKDKEERRNSDIKERRASRDGKQKEEPGEESRRRAKGQDRERTKERGHDRRQDAHRDRARAGESERARNRAQQHGDRDRDRGSRDRSRDPERARERRSEGGRDKDRPRVRNGEPSRDPDREGSREQDNLEKKSPSPGEAAERLADGSFKDSKAETEAEVSPRASRSVTTKTSTWRSRNSVEGTRDASADSAVSDDNATGLWHENIEPEPAAKQKEGEVGPSGRDEAAPPVSTEPPDEAPPHARRIPRPGSARPAPPRVKRQESSEVLPTDRSGSGKPVSNVIIDSQNSDNEEDRQFVVEAAPQLSETAGLEMVQAVEFEEDEKHGGLVKKILETKKDYEKVQQSPKPGEKEKSLVFESAWKKEKDIVSKEIEKLRVSIQTVCKSALPLGKMMDYIQEDVDAMQNELQVWSGENKQLAEALRQEQSITDGTVEPLKAELAELEQLIKDQRDRICAVKANILRNEEKIQKMVYSINLSSRR